MRSARSVTDAGPVDRFYTRWAGVYDLLATRTPGVRRVRRTAIDRMAVRPGMTAIDMGCGPGPNFGPLRRGVGESGTVVGVDLATGAIGRARDRIDRRDWGNVHVARGDATRPPVTAPDAILATFVVGMFARPADVVDAWCDALGSGGRIGLIHFARSDRAYGVLPDLALQGLVLASTPGARRSSAVATMELDRRVRAGHAAVREACRECTHTTHWGGVLHVLTGTVD